MKRKRCIKGRELVLQVKNVMKNKEKSGEREMKRLTESVRKRHTGKR
jgi:hypothetical protein